MTPCCLLLLFATILADERTILIELHIHTAAVVSQAVIAAQRLDVTIEGWLAAAEAFLLIVTRGQGRRVSGERFRDLGERFRDLSESSPACVSLLCFHFNFCFSCFGVTIDDAQDLFPDLCSEVILGKAQRTLWNFGDQI